MQYPVTGPNPSGVLIWNILRLSQQVEARWSTIETSAGVYDATALANLDSIITFQRQNGADIYFGVYGTPAFYAQTAANPTYGDDVTIGPWGGYGECSYPNSLAALSNFTTMIVNRYNKVGGAWYDTNFATLGKGIKYWETWNEPQMLGAGNDNITGSGWYSTKFWWGTPAQMVDMAQTQYAAIKAADATIEVTTPGWSGINNLGTFFTTVGTITGKTGLESCESLNYHLYRHNPPFMVYGKLWADDIINGRAGVFAVKAWLKNNGYNLSISIGETGADWDSTTSDMQAWLLDSAELRYKWTARTFMVYAAFGVRFVCPWRYSDAAGNSGNWQADTDGVIKAANDFASKASGKTIVSGNYRAAGSQVTLNFSDATSWTV